MKRSLIFLILVAIISIFVVACGDPEDPEPLKLVVIVDAVDGASGLVDIGIGSPESAICRSINTCRAAWRYEVDLRLVAIPDEGSHFIEWSGPCSGSEPICTFRLDRSVELKALFGKDTEIKHVLTVRKTGIGTGTVKDGFAESVIDCGEHCSKDILEGSTVVLTATADAGSIFNAWTGACSGASVICTVTMTEAKTVTAKFDLETTTKHKL